jgi:hypothetical protein
MADLRIVDAPVLLQESITDDVKMPTGGLGNFSVRLGDILWYVVTKEQLANKNYVDLSSKGVKDSLDEHIADKTNPHQVTKAQVGLGNVDNTSDIDKPISNAVSSAIITATNDMATKTYVNQKDNLKADVAYVDGKDGDLTTLTTTDKTSLVSAINEVKDDTKGVVALYDKNVQAGAGANGWTANLVKDASGKTQQQINDVSIKNGDYANVLSTTIKLLMNSQKGSFKFGLKGDGAFDDNNNNFRGLAKPTEPWADENTGIGSTMFGRDNANPAYLSLTNGHGNSTYGAASMAGGAGSGTGNPDVPSDGATYGYCSLAYGKNTQALGRISTAFGDGNQANSRRSYSSGAESRSGAGLATHPNASGGNGVVSDGDCAYSHGWRAYAYGDYSVAMGFAVGAYNSSMCFGAGVNAGTRLDNTLPNSLAMGYGVSIPTIIMSKNDGTVEGFGKLGINTKNPTERIDINIQNGDKVSVSVPASGTGSLDLQGKLSSGANASIFRIEYNSPNAGSAYGVTNFYQNGNKAFSLNESGEVTFEKRIVMKNRLDLTSFLMIGDVKVLGGQQPAIADSNGTATDNQRAINAILAALRGHGLIAS